jgi:hypothetical protein
MGSQLQPYNYGYTLVRMPMRIVNFKLTAHVHSWFFFTGFGGSAKHKPGEN